MNKNIKNALIALLNEENIVASWGISDSKISKTSLEFVVSGFMYQGKVKIIPVETNCKIFFDNGEIIYCSIEELVKTLDIKIEKTSNYGKDIHEWIVRKHFFKKK